MTFCHGVAFEAVLIAALLLTNLRGVEEEEVVVALSVIVTRPKEAESGEGKEMKSVAYLTIPS